MGVASFHWDDPLLLDAQLTEEEKMVRDAARDYSQGRLAPRIVAQVMELVRRLRDDEGLTVLLVEQNARSALGIADKGIVLNLGKVVAEADGSALAADEALRRHYLGF